MRLSTAVERDEATGLATLHAALDAGISTFDTAHAYGLGDDELGHNERLLAKALGTHPRGGEAFVISKGGMIRPRGDWKADGRARVLRTHAEATASALGRPADLWLIHAPDPSVDWETSVRALAGVKEAGLAKSIGVSNVNLAQLEQAVALAPISAVELVWNALDDSSVISGVVARCFALGLDVIASSPLGGPRHAKKLLGSMIQIAQRHRVAPAAVALAALLAIDPRVKVIPGPRTPAAVREVAATVALTEADLFELRATFPALRPVVSRARSAPTVEGEVVLVMGLQGAGKSTLVSEWVDRGYQRLNRDTLDRP